ncbi:hypothetical protein PIROE2DRAFT_61463 [Piromyces sp. E2]|nr:hypothetical protein PIROE2DRAFT_61463 [Piromyces sp. E2]|eukprot:OUM63129.1 hypothetical protein PIROE2DRAFT_61463 [Piromyces sp. E2]
MSIKKENMFSFADIGEAYFENLLDNNYLFGNHQGEFYNNLYTEFYGNSCSDMLNLLPYNYPYYNINNLNFNQNSNIETTGMYQGINTQNEPEIETNYKFKNDNEFNIKPEINIDPDVKSEYEFKIEPEVKNEYEFKIEPEVKNEYEFKIEPKVKNDYEIKAETQIKFEPENESEYEFIPKTEIKSKIDTKINKDTEIEKDTEMEIKTVIDKILNNQLLKKIKIEDNKCNNKMLSVFSTPTDQYSKKRTISSIQKYKSKGRGGNVYGRKRPNHSARVSNILKKWLFTNHSYPYPTVVQKNNLCSVTGLTKTQLNNWFVNARRRLL